MTQRHNRIGTAGRFFHLLESSAEEARQSVRLLGRSLQHPGGLTTLDAFVAVRRREKRITAEIHDGIGERSKP